MMTTFVAQRSEDLNKKSQGGAENPHQTRSKKGVFEKEKEVEKIQKDKSKKQTRQETPRIEEVSESEDEVEAVAPTTSKRRELPYVEVPPLKVVARAVTQIAKGVTTERPPQAYKSRAPVEEEVDIEKLVEQVLDIEVNVPLRSLAGASTAVRDEIKKQVTRVRKPTERPSSPTLGVERPRPRKI
jgi:hypothetical protein